MKKYLKSQALALAFIMSFALAAPFAFSQTATTGQDETTAKQERRAAKRANKKQRRGRMGMALFRRLDLTDDQKAQMKQIRTSHREATKALREQLRASRRELRQARQGGTFDEALASQKLSEIAPLKAKLMGERIKLREAQMAVLTAEQKAKLNELREKRRARRTQ
jgi:protein CpxP